jgi:tRNA(Arg) A34 adenosine deaminase TadA
VSANGFLYNMVRILVDTMLEVGSGKLPEDAIARALDSGRRPTPGATDAAAGTHADCVCNTGFDTDVVLNGHDGTAANWERYMRLALGEAAAAFEAGEVPVGSVLVPGRRNCSERAQSDGNAWRRPPRTLSFSVCAAAWQSSVPFLAGCTLFVYAGTLRHVRGCLLNAKLDGLVFGAFDERPAAAAPEWT